MNGLTTLFEHAARKHGLSATCAEIAEGRKPTQTGGERAHQRHQGYTEPLQAGRRFVLTTQIFDRSMHTLTLNRRRVAPGCFVSLESGKELNAARLAGLTHIALQRIEPWIEAKYLGDGPPLVSHVGETSAFTGIPLSRARSPSGASSGCSAAPQAARPTSSATLR
mmetsp:Transcript_46058/g.106251  ORF Transcript_46058/g.106251 Transcript_46058/m.106251 type:complete len:166 (-) Transcript_46058:305-802(-)